MAGQWKRVSMRRKCPICDKPDWCVYIGPDDAPTAVICQREESDRRCRDAGWLHRLRDDDNWRSRPQRVEVPLPDDTSNDAQMVAIATRSYKAITRQQVAQLSRQLGLSPSNLKRLRIGWLKDAGAYTYPMRRADGSVCGIRLRARSGFKWSVTGSKNGLFIPIGQADVDELVITEGPTDLCALLDLGFAGIGRPDCQSGVKLIGAYVREHRPRSVTIIADDDAHGAGWRGAEALAEKLVMYVPELRLVTPPGGINDAREWKNAGATYADIAERISATPPIEIGIQLATKG